MPSKEGKLTIGEESRSIYHKFCYDIFKKKRLIVSINVRSSMGQLEI